MFLSSFVTLAQSSSVTTMDALPHLTGMLLVISTLAILWGLCELVAKLVKALTPAQAEIPAPVNMPGPLPAIAPVAEYSISPEVVALIAAAVATVTVQNHRIISIKRQSSSQWEKAGRHSVLTSHRIR